MTCPKHCRLRHEPRSQGNFVADARERLDAGGGRPV